jgi:long-chain fatty acid transport protein
MRRLALFFVAVTSQAHAAGLSRPNVLGARAIGMGGAFAAIADDATAVWHNPAGTAIYGDTSLYLGGEMIILRRSYTPSPDSPLGMANAAAQAPNRTITENTSPTLIPIVGATTRFAFGKLKPNRFALSVLAYNVFGGTVSYNPRDVQQAGLLSTTILDYEIAPTLAYQVTDVLALGAAIRIGINSFSVNDAEPAFRANLSGSGVGVGGTLGVMVKPHRLVQIGAVYRTTLSATLNGSGAVTVTGSMPANHDFSLGVTWPQSAALSVAVAPHPRVLASVQGEWSGWSSVQRLNVDLTGLGAQARAMRYSDSYALHLGVQGVVTRFLVLRLGGAVESSAIPDSTMRRENQDGLKATLAGGFGLHFWRVFIDGAFEGFLPLGARNIPLQVGTDNEAGRYVAHIYTAELSAQIRF